MAAEGRWAGLLPRVLASGLIAFGLLACHRTQKAVVPPPDPFLALVWPEVNSEHRITGYTAKAIFAFNPKTGGPFRDRYGVATWSLEESLGTHERSWFEFHLDKFPLRKGERLKAYTFGESLGDLKVTGTTVVRLQIPQGEFVQGSVKPSFNEGEAKSKLAGRTNFIALFGGPPQRSYACHLAPELQKELQNRILAMARETFHLPSEMEVRWNDFGWFSMDKEGNEGVLASFSFYPKNPDGKRGYFDCSLLVKVSKHLELTELWRDGGPAHESQSNFTLLDAVDLDGDNIPELFLQEAIGGGINEQYDLLHISKDQAYLTYQGPNHGY